MVSTVSIKPLTEKAVLYFLYHKVKERGSKVFFNIKHTISSQTIFSSALKTLFFAPDVDMLEITPNNEVIGYETKGQQKRGKKYEWPTFYDGLGQALFYLKLPHIHGGKQNGGAFDKVFVVHACSEPENIKRDEELGLKIYEITPIGFICVTRQGKIIKLVEAKKNPLFNEDTKNYLLQNRGMLEKFSENGRTFRGIKEAGENFIKQKI